MPHEPHGLCSVAVSQQTSSRKKSVGKPHTTNHNKHGAVPAKEEVDHGATASGSTSAMSAESWLGSGASKSLTARHIYMTDTDVYACILGSARLLPVPDGCVQLGLLQHCLSVIPPTQLPFDMALCGMDLGQQVGTAWLEC